MPEIAKESTQKHVEDTYLKSQEKKKKNSEDETREKLRGFTRTIPSFLMAYGNRDVTLLNYDKKVDPEDFLDVTGITIEEFRKLRDGLTINENGEEKEIAGLFDENVFNSSIEEFFNNKDRLSDYYNTEKEEDIFDYIPSQKTNQRFTPRWVVDMMLDQLEEEYPGVFENKNLKFADLYSKSGMFLVEIIKRLNIGLENEIKDEKERIKWIIENQIYALAPTKTIYNITKNYIMSDFEGIDDKNIKQFDLTPSAMNGTAKEEIKRLWGENMKFDIIVGNPPYQENFEHRSEQPSLYNYFYDAAIELADLVTYITPARFLFNVGSTSKKWNQKMLNDSHFKVEYFEQNSEKIFPGADIKGGVAITLYNRNNEFKPIDVFMPYHIMNLIVEKVDSNRNISEILYSTTSYKYSELLMKRNPEYDKRLSGGPRRYAGSSVFDTLPEIFFEEMPLDGKEYIKIYGRQNNSRKFKYILRDYFLNHENLDKYKVICPAANGTGKLGEVLSDPIIAEPGVGHTQTFISFGAFDEKNVAENLLKYIKTKFARTMLGVKKITQSNSGKDVWKYVPLQDFTENSDIDWKKSIPEIDKQLYNKYGLSQEEIDFIEEKVTPME